MPPPPDDVAQPPGGDHDLIAALKPDQEKLAQLTKQLQQMTDGPGLMDKLKAFRHGGMENAMEKLRDQIAEVQQGMFDKISPAQQAGQDPGGPPDPLKQLQGQVEKLQKQLGIDSQLKQSGLPGLLTQDQCGGVKDLIQKSQKQIESLIPGMQGEQQGVERKMSVREMMGQKQGNKQGLSVAVKPRGPSV